MITSISQMGEPEQRELPKASPRPQATAVPLQRPCALRLGPSFPSLTAADMAKRAGKSTTQWNLHFDFILYLEVQYDNNSRVEI